MRKRILSLISLIVLVFVLSTTLVACQTTLSNEEAIKTIEEGIAQTIELNTFLIKEKTKLSAVSYRSIWFNQHEKSEDSKYDNTSLEFSDVTILDIVGTIDSKVSYTFGASISKDIKKPNKADPSAFIPYLFEYTRNKVDKEDTLVNKEPKTHEEVLAIDLINQYLPKNILKNIMGLTLENVEILSATAQGKVKTIKLIVKQEGNYFAQFAKGIEISLLNDKIYKVASLDAEETYRLDITYYGPNINIPNYDA